MCALTSTCTILGQKLASFQYIQFMSVNLNGFGHTPQDVEMEYELKWQEEEFTELQFSSHTTDDFH